MKNYFNTKHQTPNTKHQTPNTKHQSLNWTFLFSTLVFLFFANSLTAQIKVWNNNHVTTGYSTVAPNEQFHVNGDMYCIPKNVQSGGFYFENFYNNDYGNAATFFNEPILKPQFGMSMWLGNVNHQLYRVYSRRVYQSQGATIWSSSDSRLKMNIKPWNESALAKLTLINAYHYDMDPSKFGDVPEEKLEKLTQEGKNQIGFLAQEIKEVLPEMVDAPEGSYMAVNYGMLIPVLVEAIKEQQQLILELQAKVAALEATEGINH